MQFADTAADTFSAAGRDLGDLSAGVSGHGKADLAAVQEVVSQCVREQTTMWFQYIAEAERCVFDMCQKVWTGRSVNDLKYMNTLGLTSQYSRDLVSLILSIMSCF